MCSSLSCWPSCRPTSSTAWTSSSLRLKSYTCPKYKIKISTLVCHSTQTRNFAPAAPLVGVHMVRVPGTVLLGSSRLQTQSSVHNDTLHDRNRSFWNLATFVWRCILLLRCLGVHHFGRQRKAFRVAGNVT